MSITSKIIKKVSFCLLTVMTKIKWGNSIKVNGIFQRLWDTQIIISNGGHISVGGHVSFQKRVSLTSWGGGTNYWGKCFI